VFYTHKAYLNAKGGPATLNLTHDVKRAIVDAKVKKGLILVLSTQGTAAVKLIENDAALQKEFLDHILKQFETGEAGDPKRRSHTGANCFHQMAASIGLTLSLAFDNGRLLTSAFHEIVAFDFEPKPGRREFLITILGEN
jgi:thiamine phosphate synthase YjbQ (UPF0047 family)